MVYIYKIQKYKCILNILYKYMYNVDSIDCIVFIQEGL